MDLHVRCRINERILKHRNTLQLWLKNTASMFTCKPTLNFAIFEKSLVWHSLLKETDT